LASIGRGLYEEVLPLPDKYDEPLSSTGTIAQNLQARATPGFVSDVTNGDHTTQALTDLFIEVASSTASLTQ
jgi:hypothetical protein